MQLTKNSDFYIFDYVFNVKTTNAAIYSLREVAAFGVPINSHDTNWLKDSVTVNVTINDMVNFLRKGQSFHLNKPMTDAVLIDQFIEYHLETLKRLSEGFNRHSVPLEDIEDLKTIQDCCKLTKLQTDQTYKTNTGSALLDLIDQSFLSREVIARVDGREKTLKGALPGRQDMKVAANRFNRRGNSGTMDRLNGGKSLNGR